jgi:hypothetical protein
MTSNVSKVKTIKEAHLKVFGIACGDQQALKILELVEEYNLNAVWIKHGQIMPEYHGIQIERK